MSQADDAEQVKAAFERPRCAVVLGATLLRVNQARRDARLADLYTQVLAGEFDPQSSTRAYPIADLARALERFNLPQLAQAARRGAYGAPRTAPEYAPTPVGERPSAVNTRT